MTYRILVGSYTHEVFTLEFDSKSSSISTLATSTVGFHPSWVTTHPEDPSLVFACLEQSDGGIVALKYDNTGKGTVVASAPSGGQDPCHLLVKDDELFIANYSSGDFAILPVSHKPPYILSQTPAVTRLTGSGPNKERQLSAHAHGVYWIEETKEILVPDLGGDFVYRFRKDGGAWDIAGKIKFESGGGPRHIALHDGVLYTLLELKSSVVKHVFPSLPQEPVFLADSSTLLHPPPLPNEMLAAEILIPQPNSQYPTTYVYISNRNDPSPDGDTIAIFEANASKSLMLVKEVRTGLKHLRGMAFGGSHDQWLVAGGVNGGGVKIFERIDGGKNLKLIAAKEDIQGPTAFLWR
ncbi:putative isomerase YbhE [Moniliophthora roreri MCA 2997]|uniref:Isomerase YbhE n=2 Tax=Moniliophthora roreri TaxID=221103 RepID=V2WZ32_MONRO|nr:putative isomerase YbhE [Moniliophthora roreri MCA 2997]KAI3605488.1 putative isomerase YbhE [Moniliophthora roreri]